MHDPDRAVARDRRYGFAERRELRDVLRTEENDVRPWSDAANDNPRGPLSQRFQELAVVQADHGHSVSRLDIELVDQRLRRANTLRPLLGLFTKHERRVAAGVAHAQRAVAVAHAANR